MKIGFVGKMQAGKTTAAQHMADKYGFKRFRFAQGVRDIGQIIQDNPNIDYATQQILNYAKLDRDHYPDVKKVVSYTVQATQGKSERVFLQTLGTEGFRKMMNQDFWIHVLYHNDEFYSRVENDNNVAIDDVRFLNEAKFCKSIGMTLVKINISPEKQIERFTKSGKMQTNQKDMNHASESEIDLIKADHTINGGKPLKEFLADIDSIYHNYINEQQSNKIKS